MRNLLLVSAVFAVCILSSGCAASPPQAPAKSEAPPPPVGINPGPQSRRIITKVEAPKPPKPAEVRNAVSRVFQGVVVLEQEKSPHFFAGDFNGDRSQDLAVIVRPVAGKLPLINDELAAWILVDPTRPATRQLVRMDEDGLMLAIIHGFGSSGWRHSQASQTYVLKGVAQQAMRVRPRRQLVRGGKKDQLPQLWGDVIEQTLDGQPGFLYYNGAKYAWYDPRTFNAFATVRIVHGRAR